MGSCKRVSYWTVEEVYDWVSVQYPSDHASFLQAVNSHAISGTSAPIRTKMAVAAQQTLATLNLPQDVMPPDLGQIHNRFGFKYCAQLILPGAIEWARSWGLHFFWSILTSSVWCRNVWIQNNYVFDSECHQYGFLYERNLLKAPPPKDPNNTSNSHGIYSRKLKWFESQAWLCDCFFLFSINAAVFNSIVISVQEVVVMRMNFEILSEILNFYFLFHSFQMPLKIIQKHCTSHTLPWKLLGLT